MARWTVIYCRFSSEMQRRESCDDQERHVRADFARKGIDVTNVLVLRDEAESATRADRDNFQKVQEMVARGEIAILGVYNQGRFSRAVNAAAFIQDLVFSGARFVSVTEGIDTTELGWQLKVQVMELHHSHTIHELAGRVRHGQEGRVLADASAGDYPVGYESFYLDPNWQELLVRRGPKPRKGLRINEPAAKWVIQVFLWFAVDLRSLDEIARELTRQNVPKGHRTTKRGWHREQVRRMLKNEKYIGKWPWGRTITIRNSEGKKKQVAAPPDQVVLRDRPELAIIKPEQMWLWNGAQQRLQELKDKFGPNEGQKHRGRQKHRQNVYPDSLLAGLIHCGGTGTDGHPCGARLWTGGSDSKRHYRCPNHTKGLCNMTCQVKLVRAEEALLGFLGTLLASWPEWLGAATASMRVALEQAAKNVPQDLEADKRRLTQLQKRIDNLVDALANGVGESAAVKAALASDEKDAKETQERIKHREKLQEAPVSMPDDGWVQEQLASLVDLLRVHGRPAAKLLHKLIPSLTAHRVVLPGKKRGFVQLRFTISPWATLREVLHGKLPEAVLSTVQASEAFSDVSTEFTLDLGGPTRMDQWAPEIAKMRAQGIKWEEILRLTGLGSGPAYVAWKRWTDAQKPKGEAG